MPFAEEVQTGASLYQIFVDVMQEIFGESRQLIVDVADEIRPWADYSSAMARIGMDVQHPGWDMVFLTDFARGNKNRQQYLDFISEVIRLNPGRDVTPWLARRDLLIAHGAIFDQAFQVGRQYPPMWPNKFPGWVQADRNTWPGPVAESIRYDQDSRNAVLNALRISTAPLTVIQQQINATLPPGGVMVLPPPPGSATVPTPTAPPTVSGPPPLPTSGEGDRFPWLVFLTTPISTAILAIRRLRKNA